MRQRKELEWFQREAARDIMDTPRVLMRMPVGAGKTASTLTALIDLTNMHTRRILVISTLNIVEKTWPEEIELWAHVKPYMRYSVITGSEDGRLFALRTPARMYLINRENVVWLWQTMERLKMKLFDTVVIDESTMMQSAKKLTTPKKVDGVIVRKASLSQFGAAIKFCSAAKRVIELTGTLAPNGLESLYGQVYPLDFGQRLGTSKTAFHNRWFTKDYMGYNYEPRPGAEKEITDRVKDIVIAPDIDKHLKAIETRDVVRWVKLSEKEQKRYRTFEKKMYDEITDIEAISKGVLTNKLLQFANGSMFDEDREPVHIHDHKLHALEDILSELGGEPAMVVYSFTFDLERICKRFKKARILSEDRHAYDDWNKGKVPILLVHPKSAGHGLNLQFGGHHQIWYGMTWSLELYLQTRGRLPRRGQKAKHVMIHHILAEGTKDRLVFDKMHLSGITQDAITDAVRREIRRTA